MTVISIQNSNCDNGAKSSEECLPHEEHEASNGVHNNSREEISGDEVEALTGSLAEAVTMHCYVNVGKFVDVLDYSLDASKNALEGRNQAH